ncbi:salt tolerance receptor-like cytoplasmic kinase 1 [Elaeis guineensis]|uniref:Salt tolerance receptor-like cytoplasmic kinase 1 n=1 Tax=Elaeis guineensis var. tenera TaxID=51953 RepID=A0A6I9RX50_ELAGV|nr:salt tolerance receptor-like cytoplasmic kinase 1 [Elaeis guineensis]
MDLLLVIGLASASLVLSLALLSLAYVTMLRRYRIPCCGGCRDADDLELGHHAGARVADGPDPEPELEPVKGEPAPRRFGWPEIESLTGNFISSAVIGEGGSSTVYLASLPSPPSSLAALKVLRSSERLHRAFRLELDVLLRLRHPHIVRLLGFCDDREEGVLVFEYVPNGTLHEKLHGGAVLPWERRVAIAYQVAQALDYLHERCDLHIVHGDIKASNVLLGDTLDAKLCDFGFARMGFSAAVQPPSTRSVHPMMGSPGYVDPHYLRSGIVSKKSDVYSFGVLLLELITGMEAFCSEREQLLTAVMGPALRDTGRGAGEMVDPRLNGEYDTTEAAAMAALAALCVGENPTLRPSMAEVLRIMDEKASSSISTVDSKSKGMPDL